MGKLFLLPNTLGETDIHCVIPGEVAAIIKTVKVFASENPRNTRRYLKKIDKDINLELLTFVELSEHSSTESIKVCLDYLEKGDVGIISEAGCPGIADPGEELVAMAHRKGVRVIPLVGPSSILMALIASGMNGQRFSFNGYLPVNEKDRQVMLKNYERQSTRENRTQIFIETPYRNMKLFEEMLKVLHPKTLLSIACNITTENEYIRTMPVQEWKTEKPDIRKKPAIFLFYAR